MRRALERFRRIVGDFANLTGNTLIFRLLMVVVLLAPLPLGANRPWAWSMMAVAVGLLCGVWGVLAVVGKAQAPLPFRRLWPVAVPFAMVLAWACAQASSLLPSDLWHPLWMAAQPALEIVGAGEVVGTVSADPAMTRAAILRLATYGGIFWLAVQLACDRKRAREALILMAAASTLYAVYGLATYFSGAKTILWMSKWAYVDDLTSTFVNRNAYGAYAGLGMVFCFALFLHALRPSSRPSAPRAYELAETFLIHALPYLMALVILGSALLLSHSRGAFISTGAALAVLMIALVTGRIVRPRTGLLSAFLVLGMGFAILGMSGDRMVQRFANETAQDYDEERLNAYHLTMRAIEDAPLTGTGLGAFTPTFRLYRNASLSRAVDWDYAHNIPLEMGLDLGLLAATLFYLCLAAIVGVCVRGLIVRRRDGIYPAAALGAATLLGAHGLVDFSAQMPAIAAMLAMILGIGYAQSWNTADRHRNSGEPV